MELEQVNQKLNETRVELLNILNHLSHEQLNKQKNAESWTISQICQHLSITEELYVVAIRRGLKSKKESSIANQPVELLLDRSKRLEAPDIAKPSNEVMERQAIIDKLYASRQKLNELLSTVEDPTLLNRRHYIHPVFKELSLMDWLKSLYIHEQRHIKQIKENIDEK
jgi:uncharacterized damage-inducible protein DinB